MNEAYKALGVSENVLAFSETILSDLKDRFAAIDAIAEANQLKVIAAMQKNRVAANHFNLSTGYGYDDEGRDTLERVYADCFGAEAALVRPQITCGTHALALALGANLLPGDELLSPVGGPYDTLEEVIGIRESVGSLKEYGVSYRQVDLLPDGSFDTDKICAAISKKTKLITIQRSKGYATRPSFSVAQIGELIALCKQCKPDVICMVDNCYGEFTELIEPVNVGADLMVGSLIKNPGGGLAPTGGYIAGRKNLVELCAYRLNAPGLGKELGCTLDTPRDMYLGFYYAPGVVCEAIKTAIYAQCLLELVGKKPIPRYCEDHNDIVTCFDAGTADALIGFCRGVQAASPVDSYAAPEPSPEPGYTDEVVMASGSFTQGSTIELSCDGPLRAPYTCYLQGGLNFAASRAGVLLAVQKAYFKE